MTGWIDSLKILSTRFVEKSYARHIYQDATRPDMDEPKSADRNNLGENRRRGV